MVAFTRIYFYSTTFSFVHMHVRVRAGSWVSTAKKFVPLISTTNGLMGKTATLFPTRYSKTHPFPRSSVRMVSTLKSTQENPEAFAVFGIVSRVRVWVSARVSVAVRVRVWVPILKSTQENPKTFG